MTLQAFKNNERVAPDYLADRAFVYADGFFETMRVVNTRIPLLSYHFDRALASAETLKIPLTEFALKAHVDRCLSELDDENAVSSAYKLIVSRGSGGRGGYPPYEPQSQLYSYIRGLSERGRDSVSLRLVNETLPSKASFNGLKLINRLDYSVATQGIAFESNEEALFIDDQQHLVETMHHNLFFIKGRQIYTPELDGFGVKGVMRALIISNVEALGLKLVYGQFSVEDLISADSVFISNALDGVVRVDNLDGRSISSSPIFSDIKFLVDKVRLS